MAINSDVQVSFDTIYQSSGGGALRVIVPKSDYTVVAEDVDYYYLRPTFHLGVPSDKIAKAPSSEEGGTK